MTSYSRPIIRAAICLLLTLRLTVSGQDLVFKATTRLVEVSVVATDEKGVPVQDLKKEDFTILEDGKRQEVSHFFTEAMLRAGAAPPKLPKGIYTNRPELLPHAPRTVNAIVIDYLNTPWAAQTATREQLLQVLRTLGENDVVAIYTLGQTLTILHDYTTDRKSLEAKLANASGVLSLRSKSESELVSLVASRWGSAFGESRADMEKLYVATMQRTRSMLTIRSLSLIARHMAGIPGRKNLIWMSSGFPITIATQDEMIPTVSMTGGGGIVNNMPSQRRAIGGSEGVLLLDMIDKSIRQISASGVTIYGIDVNGLLVPMAGADSTFSFEIANRALARIENEREAQAGLTEFSSRTGGVATINTNNISGALKRALDDARYSYSLAYHTTNSKADGKFRKIEIKVNRPGVKLRYRNGYSADEQGKEPAGIMKGDLDEASQSPVSQTGVLLTAQMKTSPSELNMVLQIEPTQLSLQPGKDGWTGALEMMFIQRTADGKMNGLRASMPLKLTEENYQTVMKKGLLYRRTMQREAGANAMRVVVRDSNNGATGTLDMPLEP